MTSSRLTNRKGIVTVVMVVCLSLLAAAVVVRLGASFRRNHPEPSDAGKAVPAPATGSQAQRAAVGDASGVGVTPEGAASLAPSNGGTALNTNLAAPAAAARQAAIELPPTPPEVARLNALLDDNDDPAILKQARTMLRSTSAEVRRAAVDALRWVGGAEAARDLVGSVADADPEIASEAVDGLMDALDELDQPEVSARLIEAAIRTAASTDDAEALCLRLSGLDETLSVPALLNLLKDGTERTQTLAREYLEFVTGGEAITTRAEGEAWLRQYTAEEAEQETE